MEDALHFVANLAEHLQLFFFGPLGVGGVFERPMATVHLARKDRAGLVGISANGDYGFHTDREEFVQVF